MKTLYYVFAFIILFMGRHAFCDIIPENSHSVYKCVKIVNLDGFENVYFIGYNPETTLYPEDPYLISPTVCLTKGYKFNVFEIWAIEKGNFTEQDVLDFEYPNEYGAVESNIEIRPYGGYVHDSIPIDSIAEFYRIVGFTWKNVVLYKWKEVVGFNNGQSDSVKFYEYDGDSASLADHILNIGDVENSSGIVLSPNPASHSIHIFFKNYYTGPVTISIVSSIGKLQDQFVFSKASYEYNYNIDLMNMSKGIYFIKFNFGDIIEVKRILIE